MVHGLDTKYYKYLAFSYQHTLVQILINIITSIDVYIKANDLLIVYGLDRNYNMFGFFVLVLDTST